MADELRQLNENSDAIYSLAPTILEIIPFGIIVADELSVIMFVNSKTENLFDYDRSQLIGQKLDMLMPADRRERHADHWERFRRDPRPRFMGIGMQLPGLRRDGQQFPMEIQIDSRRVAKKWFALAFIRSLETLAPGTENV